MKYTTPANMCDSYKVGHRAMYPPGMTRLQSNWTARGSRMPDVNKVVFFGLQAFLQRYLRDDMHQSFFAMPRSAVVARHKRRVESLLGQPFNAEHWGALHELGYVPLRFCAVPEGTEVPLRVPCFTVENTHDDFAWLVNYFESVLSAEIWLPMTSATVALRFRRMLDTWAEKTGSDPNFVDFQGHDFSFRGMGGMDAASASGAGHLLCFAGSDGLSAMDWAETHYDATGYIGSSVPASEHSNMCAGTELGERETFEYIMNQYPTGIVSIVSDTWDLWKVLKETLPSIRDKIVTREGKLVIRPDSGDPVNIICGDPKAPRGTPAQRGVINLLWEEFGGTNTQTGHRVLDPHIGAIYGDAITFERANEICRRLEEQGFASTNIVLGIGSFTYQYVTRDTFGMAMKATWAMVDGESRVLYKDPVTDNGEKRSGRGRLAVLPDKDKGMVLVNEATPEQEAKSLLIPTWENGRFLHRYTFQEIAQRVGVRKLLPQAPTYFRQVVNE